MIKASLLAPGRNTGSGMLRKTALAALDGLLVQTAVGCSLLLRYEDSLSPALSGWGYGLFFLITALYVASFAVCGIYRTMWRYAGLPEVMRLVLAAAAAALVSLLSNQLFAWGISLAVLIMAGVWTLFLTGGARLIRRGCYTVREKARGEGAEGGAVMIVGAGFAGTDVLALLHRGGRENGRPLLFVDDDPGKQNLCIHNVPVRGTTADIPRLVAEHGIREIIIAIPSLSGEAKDNLIALCNGTKCRVRIMTPPQHIQMIPQRPQVRELNITDFLSRKEVALDMEPIAAYLTGKTVLVTGGGGSIGSEICRQVMRFLPRMLIIFDMYENCAYELLQELKQKYGPEVPALVLIGSIRDKRRLDEVFGTYHPQVVFHAAAHKHVPLMECCPAEAVKNNVIGTLNVLEAASSHGVERLVQLSTDKAVNPSSVMGATKRLAEMLLQSFAGRTDMKCMAVRFGNVLGSRGSVIPLFEAQIKKGGPVTVTHPDITRYFMTIPEAAQLVLQAGSIALSGAIFVLDMGEPVKIMDLADKLIRFYGYEPNTDIEISITGLRAGEKLHEELLTDDERDAMLRTDHDKIFIAPAIPVDEQALYEQVELLFRAADRGDAGLRDALFRAIPACRPQEAPMPRQIAVGA